MSIQVINNISSIVAENAVSNTQAHLQNTLQQLSTGLKINSGADDPAGMSIADGLGANISALTQSGQNASNGIGLLQTADGALSQVTTILNQAITIATEAGNGGLTTAQSTALNTEFTSILNEIDQIGSTTNFNGTSVFNSNSTNSLSSTQGSATDPLTAGTALKAGSVTTITDSQTGGTFVFTAGAADTVGTLSAAIDAAAGTTLSTGTTATISATTGQLVIAGPAGDSLKITSTEPALGGFSPTVVAGNSANVFTSDGTGTGATNTDTAINTLSASSLSLATSNLSSTTAAQSALTAVTAAISAVAAQRGSIGASINQLTADTGVESTEVQNLTSAQNSVQNANIASVTSNLTQYNILEQTGFDALAQSNSAEQNVLKLLQ
jgi:flagellin